MVDFHLKSLLNPCYFKVNMAFIVFDLDNSMNESLNDVMYDYGI